jgi:outer membrane cobalamin receptor
LFIGFGQNNDTLKVVEVYSKSDSILHISVINSNVPHYVLDKNKLYELSSEDIGDALKFIPGTYIKDYGGIGGLKTISYRSLGASHTSIESDGVILPNTQTATVNLSNFDIFSINKLEMTTGQVQDHFSTASSFIKSNILSLKSDLYFRPNKNYEVKLLGNATTINSYQSGLSYRQNVNKKLSFGIQSLTLFGNGQYKFNINNIDSVYSATRQNSELLNSKLKGAINYELNKLKIHLSGSYTNNNQKLPGAVVLYNPYNNQDLKNTNINSTIKAEYKTNNIAIGFNTFFQNNNTTYTDHQFLNLAGFLRNNYENKSIGSGVIFNKFLKTESQKIFIGSDFLYSNLKGNQFTNSPQRFQQNSVIGISKWIYRFKIQGNLSHQFISDKTQSTSLKVSHFSPFISAAYLPFSNSSLRFRIHYKNAYRLPSFNDLYYNTIGNSNLKAENATSFNYGITYGKKLKKMIIETTMDLYRTNIENKIVAIPTKNLFNWSMQNIGNVLSYGAEFNVLATYKMNRFRITASTSQSFNQSLDVTDINSITFRNQIPYTPKYTASYNTSIGYKHTSFTTSLIHSGSRYTLNENISSNLLGGFIDLSLGVNHSFKFKNQLLYTQLQLLNVLNNNYEVIKSFPMPGRFLKLKLIYTLNK